MNKQDMVMQNDTYTLFGIISGVIVFSGWLLVGVLAALVMMALTPPQTRLQVFGMGAAAFASSFFVGPLVIEAYGFSHYSFQAQLGICFMCAAPAWMIWSIVSVVLKKWRDAKDPIGNIGRDVKRIKRWWL